MRTVSNVGAHTYSDRLAEHRDLTLNAVAVAIPLDIHVIRGLEVQPESVRGAKETREPEGRIRADRPSTMHDLVDAPGRHLEALGQPVLTQAERRKELFERDALLVVKLRARTRMP